MGMGGNNYSVNDHQRANGNSGGYPTGQQRRGYEFPPLGPGSQYGIVQGEQRGRRQTATGYGRSGYSRNDAQRGTQDGRKRPAKAAPGMGRRAGTQGGAKEEERKQKAGEAAKTAGGKGAQVTPERPRKGRPNPPQGTNSDQTTKGRAVHLIQVESPTARMITFAKAMMDVTPEK